MAATNAEVQQEIDSYRLTMESFTELQKTNPHYEMKERILNAIREEKNKSSMHAVVSELHPVRSNVFNLKKYKWLAAASVVLLLISIALNGIFIYKYNQTKNRYTTLLASQEQLVAKNNTIQTRMENVEQDMQLLMNPAIKPVIMKGVESHPGMLATVYFNGQDRKAYLGKSNLPKAPSGKEYQLWAIIDGKPVDMGMYSRDNDKSLTPMKSAASGSIQAFAITLEKEGGSPTPTMDQMYVMGKI